MGLLNICQIVGIGIGDEQYHSKSFNMDESIPSEPIPGDCQVSQDAKTWEQIVQEYFPDVPFWFANSILWECTGFPSFWAESEECPTAEAYFRKQLAEIKERSGGDAGLAVKLCNEDMDKREKND